MNRLLPILTAAFACVLLAAIAEPALADCGCGPGGPRRPTSQPKVSGLGIGLAGIGMAWGLTWLGFRLVGRITRK